VPDDIDRYQVISGDQNGADDPSGLSDSAGAHDGGEAPDPDRFRYGVDPFPKLDQFESIAAYIEFAEAVRQRIGGLPVKRAPSRSTRARTADEHGSTQVGLRLPAGDYERLVELGRENGVAPATMARVLVVRGIRDASKPD
jgi:hypothetical protein